MAPCWTRPAVRPNRCRRCSWAAISAPGSTPRGRSPASVSRGSALCRLLAGFGVLIALGESSCGLHESARVIDYLARSRPASAVRASSACGRSPTPWPPWPTGRLIPGSATGSSGGRPRSAAAARATTPTAPRGSFVSALQVFGHEIEDHRTGAVAPCRPACPWAAGVRHRAVRADEHAPAGQPDRLRGTWRCASSCCPS